MFRFSFAILLILSAESTFAQDANYWSNPYGAGGFFMPGATLARNYDSGVLFYNPALQAYNTKNAAMISGSIYDFRSTSIKKGAGDHLPLNSTSVRVTPVMASNTIYLNLKGRPISVAFGIQNNPLMKFRAYQRQEGKKQVLNDSYSPGMEDYVGQVSTENTIDETTGTLSIGTTVSKKIAVGISFNAGLRKQSYLLDTKSRTLENSTGGSEKKIVDVSQSYLANSLNAGLGIKLGLSYDVSAKTNIGVLLSLPVIHLYGKADILSDLQVNNLNFFGTPGNNFYLLASTKQTGLRTNWKSPLSAAIGYSYRFDKGLLYVAAEYFTSIKEYDVISPRAESFLIPDTGDNKLFTAPLLKMKDVRKPVFNAAVALSYQLKEKLTGYLSLRTDFNNTDDHLFSNEAEGTKSNVSIWNLYHLQAGLNIKKRKFNLRAGALLHYGSSGNYLQVVNFDSPPDDNFLLGDVSRVAVKKYSASLVLAYVHNL